MSSSAYIGFSKDDNEGVTLDRWRIFCSRYGIMHSPMTAGGNVFYAGEVEMKYGESMDDDPALSLQFSTYYCGEAMPMVVVLAIAAFREFGGSLTMASELRDFLNRAD